MLEQLLGHLKNWFRVRDAVDGKHYGTYTIKSGSITLPFLMHGQYFRIIGSVFNDGLYQYADDLELTDETFSGTIWALAVPKAVLDLCKDIEEWDKKYSDVVATPYTSESFGGYSYTKAGGGTAENANSNGWQGVFAARLNQWRKISED